MPLHHLNSKNYSVVLLSVETDKTSYVGERAGVLPHKSDGDAGMMTSSFFELNRNISRSLLGFTLSYLEFLT